MLKHRLRLAHVCGVDPGLDSDLLSISRELNKRAVNKILECDGVFRLFQILPILFMVGKLPTQPERISCYSITLQITDFRVFIINAA